MMKRDAARNSEFKQLNSGSWFSVIYTSPTLNTYKPRLLPTSWHYLIFFYLFSVSFNGSIYYFRVVFLHLGLGFDSWYYLNILILKEKMKAFLGNWNFHQVRLCAATLCQSVLISPDIQDIGPKRRVGVVCILLLTIRDCMTDKTVRAAGHVRQGGGGVIW